MKEWLIQVRRSIHMRPEVAFEEIETSRLICEWLNRFGLQVKPGVGRTGIVGLLKGACPGKTVAFRADMDALPLVEGNSVPYASEIEGKMHACGHDAHVAILLGVARFFTSVAERVRGNIKFIFQPAEETGEGAKLMIEEGVLNNPKVDAIFGAHVFPFLPIGKVGIYEREAFAAVDQLNIEIAGIGGHAAYPHTTKDPILAAAYLITQLQSVVSRNIDPLDSAVVTIAKVNGGTSFNVIPERIQLMGTVRSLNHSVRERVRARIEEIVRGVCLSFGMEYKLDFQHRTPLLVNNPDMSRLVNTVCSEELGEDNVESLRPTMGGEDFAYYLEKCPGAFFRLGINNSAKGIVHPLHSKNFDIDEEVLTLGVNVFIKIAIKFLGAERMLKKRHADV